ncbi:MAG: SGNH/GDSL hydrolase family protein [Prevotella sp.]|nr:SGNH/GDSL hydrolase family protein [Prevotella sp.]
MRKLFTFMLLTLATTMQAQTDWTGTWATAAEFTGPSDMPKASLASTSLREIIQVSFGGEQLSLHLSNEFSKEPVEIKSIYIADAKDSCDIDAKTATYVRFNKQKSVVIPAGGTVASDIIRYKLKPLQRLSITINYGPNVPQNATSHRGSRTTSYLAQGEVKPNKPFKTFERFEHWYNITKLNVLGTGNKAVAVLGNSITDGRGSTTNHQNRWPDFMAKALSQNEGSSLKGVLNLGIGGNCVIAGGLSEPALKRFDRDILGQQGVETLIIFQGTNDIGTSRNAEQTSRSLIEAYQTLIDKARNAGIKRIIGATITAFKGNGWYSPFHEAARQVVNEWIRTSGKFDAVIDFDLLTRDPNDRERLQQQYSEDWLHLNPAGYKAMGEEAARVVMGK